MRISNLNCEVLTLDNPKLQKGNLTENLKKGLTEMLVLSCLNARSMPIHEIQKTLDEKSNSFCKVTFPYAAIYRMLESGFVEEEGKRNASQRRRMHYRITERGKAYLRELQQEYRNFVGGMELLLDHLNGESA